MNRPQHSSDAELERIRKLKLFTLAWRVFADIRQLQAQFDLRALSPLAARERRRRGLPWATTATAAVSVTGLPLYLDVTSKTVLPGGARAVSQTRRGKLLVSAVADGTRLADVRMHEGKTWSRLLVVLCDSVVAVASSTKIRGFEWSVTPSAWSINLVDTWNVDTGEALGEIKLEGMVTALAAINSRRFVVGCSQGDILFCEHSSGKRLKVIARIDYARKQLGAVVAFSVCGNRLASASDDGTVAVWDANSGGRLAVLGELGAASYYLSCVDLSDELVVVGFDAPPFVRAFSVSNGYSCISTNHAIDWVHGGGVSSLHILDSDYVISASIDRTIAISAVRSNSILARVGLAFTPRCITVLPDGLIAVSDRPCGTCSLILTPPPVALSLLKAYGDYEYGALSGRVLH